jgi:GTPase involved in cell partitioning and DNA repair
MSKTVPENIFIDLSTISGRIVKVLIDKGLVKRDGSPNFSEAERKAGIKGTVLQKAVKREGGLYDDNLDKFLRTFHVKRDWLLKGIGDMNDKNPTPAINSTSNTENEMNDIYKDLVEANTDYRLVPKIILDQYHIIPKDEVEDRREMIKVITKAKDDLISKYETLLARYEEDIDELEKENETLRSQILTGRTQS